MPIIHKLHTEERLLIQSVKEQARRTSITQASKARADMLALQEQQLASKTGAELTATKYSRRDIINLKKVFDSYDRDRSGALSREELKEVLNKQKQDAQRVDGTKKTLEERQLAAGFVRGPEKNSRGVFLSDFSDSLFRVCDVNRDGKVEFKELVRLMYSSASAQEIDTMMGWVAPPLDQPMARQALLTPEQIQEIETVFKLYDADGSGAISRDEFHSAMRVRRNDSGFELVNEMFDTTDANADGEIDLEEWTDHMRETYALPPLTHQAFR